MREFNGKLLKVLITRKGEDVSQEILKGNVTLEGLEGDSHSGWTLFTHGRQPQYPKGTEIRNDRQISILSSGELEAISASLGIPKLEISWFSGNLLISGTPNLSVLPLGSRFYFSGGVVLICSAENNPCSQPAGITQSHYPDNPDISREFVKAAMHRRGIVAYVEHPGTLLPGESFRIEFPKPWNPLWTETDEG
jgi:hypothetical protein